MQASILSDAIERLKERFDPVHGGFGHGGFGQAPKFPQPLWLERLLRHYRHSEAEGAADTRAGFIAKFTLEKIAHSALYDQNAGGFFRYALDEAWTKPQPEKMLCDNAQLLALYAQAWRLTDTALFKQVAENLAAWLLREWDSAADSVLDRQILTSWSGLLIRGLAIAGRHLARPDWIAAADQTLDFIHREMWRDGELLAVYQAGQGRFAAYLDDYALLLDGVLELLQCRWSDADWRFALALGEALLNRFQDPHRQGGFYFTTSTHEPLIQRPKPIHDDILPAGNGSAAQALIKLGRLTNSIRHLVAAERALKNAWGPLERNPLSGCALLLALEEYFFPSEVVVMRGSATALEPWWRSITAPYAPRRLTLAIPATAAELPAQLAKAEPCADPVAYLYRTNQLIGPITNLAELEHML